MNLFEYHGSFHLYFDTSGNCQQPLNDQPTTLVHALLNTIMQINEIVVCIIACNYIRVYLPYDGV
jgi:hypothetical protein